MSQMYKSLGDAIMSNSVSVRRIFSDFDSSVQSQISSKWGDTLYFIPIMSSRECTVVED